MLFIGLALATTVAAAAQRGSPTHPAAGPRPVPNVDRRLAVVASAGRAIALFSSSSGLPPARGCGALARHGSAASSPSLGPRLATAHLEIRRPPCWARSPQAARCWRRAEAAPVPRARPSLLAVLVVIAQTALNAAGAAGGNPAWVTTPQLFLATLLWVVMAAWPWSAWSTPRAADEPSAARLAQRETRAVHR